MKPSTHPIQTMTLALFLTLVAGQTAHASQQLATDMGCYNCHGTPLRGESPSMQRLTQELARLKGDAAAEQSWADEFRKGEFPHYIGAHQHLSPESAKALVHWLVEGAK